ncbi:f-box domain-containing [Pyrenophora seminiperda CCB06]|uniref:F-box domain-containing n=1 Tax=Pyrenophora seminiperda CCB06 TaxID=1302712 RepID=A0A3M7M9U3_9PLEO|nr:f-box domain-containing [Pyrenophora seminiperda CCB06]
MQDLDTAGMPKSMKPIMEPGLPESESPVPVQSRPLGRRISSTLSTILASFPVRRSTPQQDSNQRPMTAPPPEREGMIQPDSGVDCSPYSRQTSTPPAHIPLLSVSEEPCPYDPSMYHSFPSIERSRSSFCGMRSPKSRSSTPCNDCRSGSSLSHIKSVLQRKLSFQTKSQEPTQSHSSHRKHSSSSSEEGTHVVPSDIVAKRIGNPPRSASLPVPRPGSVHTPLQPDSVDHRSKSAKQDPATPVTPGASPKSAFVPKEVRPASPKLHHIHGLPNAKAYPFVHKREVTQHLAVIRAGSPSSLSDFAHAAQSRNTSSVSLTTDYSETIYYGPIISRAFSPTPERRRSPQMRRGNVLVEHTANRGGQVVAEHSNQEQPASTNQQLYHSNVSRGRQQHREREAPSTSLNVSSQIRGTVSGSEPTDGNQKPEPDVKPSLRGGDGSEPVHAPSCVLALKQLLLTCHNPRCEYNTSGPSSSDDSLPPVRIPDAAQITQAMQQTQGTAKLPRNRLRKDNKQGITYTTTQTPLKPLVCIDVPYPPPHTSHGFPYNTPNTQSSPQPALYSLIPPKTNTNLHSLLFSSPPSEALMLKKQYSYLTFPLHHSEP